MEQADLPILLRPGSDGALACATMHVLLREGLADRDYLDRFTDFSPEFEAHLARRSPEWAAAITGLAVAEIEAFARLVGSTPRTFFRLGYGFSRQRNGSTNMHAALSIPAMTGAWRHRGGGAFHSNSGTWALDKSAIRGTAFARPGVRELDMSEIGKVLTGDARALKDKGPVKALLIQNTNPMNVAPDQELTRQGFARDDLFTVVHEQFMTETALMADIVLPATTFLEHEDYYTRGGHTRVLYGPRLIEPPGEAQPNHEVINGLARRLGLDHPSFAGTAREMIAETFRRSSYPPLEEVEKTGFVDRELPDEKARYTDGFAWPDGKFRFRPDWEAVRRRKGFQWTCDPSILPEFADWWDVNEPTTAECPFRLATSPARSFLNSSFSRTPGSLRREGPPGVFIRPDDAAALGIADGAAVTVGNHRGTVELTARHFEGLQTGVLVAEGLHSNGAHRGGRGINTLIGSDQIAPFGGAAFHDAAVWIRPSVAAAGSLE